MPTALEIIGHNAALQEHWLRRFFAILIDAIVIVVFALVLNALVPFLAWPFLASSVVWGIVFFGYATLFEGVFGWTIGKRLLSLRVVAIDGAMDLVHAVVRNVSKLHFLLLILDVVIGAATHGDPRQRFLDRVAHTSVTRVDQQAYMEEQFRMLQHVPPHPVAQPVGGPGVPPGPSAAPSPVPVAPTPGAPGGWPGQAPTQSGWPQHQWDEQGQLKPAMRFCTNCGGQLVARGDGKMTCVRCGAIY